jgi:hypothetical protein
MNGPFLPAGVTRMGATEWAKLSTEFNPLDAPSSYAPFVATPLEQIDRLISLACITSEDVVADLGFGDASLLCGVLERANCSGIGCDIDHNLVESARCSVAVTTLGSRLVLTEGLIIPFMSSSAFLSATVVFLFLVPAQLADMSEQVSLFLTKPGARVIASRFEIPGIVCSHSLPALADDRDEADCREDYMKDTRWPACFLYSSTASS